MSAVTERLTLLSPKLFRFKWLGREGNVTNVSAVLVHLKSSFLSNAPISILLNSVYK